MEINGVLLWATPSSSILLRVVDATIVATITHHITVYSMIIILLLQRYCAVVVAMHDDRRDKLQSRFAYGSSTTLAVTSLVMTNDNDNDNDGSLIVVVEGRLAVEEQQES